MPSKKTKMFVLFVTDLSTDHQTDISFGSLHSFFFSKTDV